jgi:regulator of cell morphogenesis and NO signaling
MEQLTQKTIREIALAAPATVRVFEEFKIDYCCGGRRSISEACAAAGVAPDVLERRIDEILVKGESGSEDAVELRSPTKLIDHIETTHHVFTRAEIERLMPLMAKVAVRHGEHHPELRQLESIFTALADSLLPHMMKEENVLFPFIKRLDMCSENGLPVPLAPFGSVQNAVRMMMADHDTDGDRLAQMRAITHDYQLPNDACPSFTALFAGLQDLERDLHRHIHLENNVLFPAALELERV